MTKKSEVTLTAVKNDSVSHLKNGQPVRFEMTPSIGRYASKINIDLTAPAKDRWDAVVASREAEQGHFAKQGLLLLSLKSELAHGEFSKALEALDYEARQAQRAMSYARFVFSRPDKEQAELLKLPHTKVCKLATADPDVIDALFEEGEDIPDPEEVYGRALLKRVNALEKALASQESKVQAAASKMDVELQSHIITPDVPPQVSDIRRETAALYKQASLAVQSLANLAQPMMELHHIQKAQPWVRPGAVQAYTAMQSLHAELAVQMAVWRDAFGLDDVQGLPPITDHAFYQPEEAALVATHFAAMTDTHAKEGIKRANQRANELAGKRGAKRKDV